MTETATAIRAMTAGIRTTIVVSIASIAMTIATTTTGTIAIAGNAQNRVFGHCIDVLLFRAQSRAGERAQTRCSATLDEDGDETELPLPRAA